MEIKILKIFSNKNVFKCMRPIFTVLSKMELFLIHIDIMLAIFLIAYWDSVL